MTAALWRLCIEQRASFTLALRLTDDAGQPVNLTGYTARMQIRDHVGAADPPLASLSTDPGGGITISDDGQTLTVTFTGAQTAAFTWEHAVYDLLLTAPDGTADRLLRGEAEVSQAVTL